MEIAAFLILVGGVAWLWRRVETLDDRVRLLEARPGVMPDRPAASAQSAAAVPSSRASVPKTVSPPPVISTMPESAAAAGKALEVPAPGWRRSFDLEDVFGRLLPIWAGGVTLAVAGFFLVRWSIEAGLLTPSVRVLLAGLFGASLLAGGEAAYRWRERVADPRVAQALAGAGLATLYAAFYLAGSTYGLIGPAAAFVGLAAVTTAAIGLSFRFGLPSAVLGLVGGFAAPALVSSENANLPLLTLYLALVTGGLTFTGRRQGRAWIGIAALAGGLGWGGLLVASGAIGERDILLLGLYLVLLGAVLPALSGGQGAVWRWVRLCGSALAALQLSVLVAQGGFGPLEWGLYLLLGAALAWFGWREPAMREASAIAAAVGVLLTIVWGNPDPLGLAGVAAALAGLFAAVPLAQVWRGHGQAIGVAQTCGMALGLSGALYWHFAEALPAGPEPIHGLALIALAILPALASHFAARIGGETNVRWVWAAQATAVLIGYGALAQLLPREALAWTAGLIALGLAWRGATLGGSLAMASVLAIAWTVEPLGRWLEAGLEALSGNPVTYVDLPTVRATALFVVPAAIAAMAWRVLAPPTDAARRVLEAVAAAIAVVAIHTLFRHAFAAVAGSDFASTGVIQRALWEVLLFGAGWLALMRGWRWVAAIAAALALAHFGWFALVLHNPLWSAQAIGPLPLANALVPMYAVGFAALWLAARLLSPVPAWTRWVMHGAVVLLVSLLALSLLRQAFAGSVLTATPVGPTEDLLRSLTGIVLAAGFLVWGARTGTRSWRIGSLVLMVIAVLKVFLVDAAGLEGLARIASFMALGFSLIGVGWFYNRQLRGPSGEYPLPTVT